MPKATVTYPSKVVNGKARNNQGWHPKGKRAYRAAKATIIRCLTYYREPRLIHLVLSGGTYHQHKKVLTALCQKLTRANLPHEWFSAREHSKERGEHLHIFFLVDSDEARSQSVLNTYNDSWLTLQCVKSGLNKPWINPPRDPIHAGNHYAQLPYLGPGNRATDKAIERLKDALDWLSYSYKARDKHDDQWEAQGQIFSASRPKRDKEVASIATSRPIDLSGMKLNVSTGDQLLDTMIGRMQELMRCHGRTAPTLPLQ